MLVRLTSWGEELSFRIIDVSIELVFSISIKIVLVKGKERTKGEFVVFPVDVDSVVCTSSRVPIKRTEDTVFVKNNHLSAYLGIDIFVDR